MNDPIPKKIVPGNYVHTKSGKYYEVIGVALHTETHELLVIYKPFYDNAFELFSRPYDMFVGEVEINGEYVPRFQKLDD